MSLQSPADDRSPKNYEAGQGGSGLARELGYSSVRALDAPSVVRSNVADSLASSFLTSLGYLYLWGGEG